MQQAVAEINCPIGDFGGMARDREQCPRCNSDMTHLRAVDTLLEPSLATAVAADKAVDTAADTEKGTPRPQTANVSYSFLAGLLLGLVLIVVGLQVYSLNALGTGDSARSSQLTSGLGRIESRLNRISARQAQTPSRVGFSQLELRLDQVAAQQQLVLNEMVALIRGIREEIKRVQRPLTVIKEVTRVVAEPGLKEQAQPATPVVAVAPAAPVAPRETVSEPVSQKPPQFSYHTIRGSETLWVIAKRFYGAGKYYPVLLEHNPDLSIYRISRGDRIAIINDTDQAPRIYDNITIRKGGRLYWLYTTKPGDTVRSLRRRYCGGSNCLTPAPAILKDKSIEPGAKISIRL